MNNRFYPEKRRHNREKGVVLLTCLVFLLVLLVMLRYTINSAKVEEQKAGIDLDIAAAREAAQSALRFAEFYISKQGELFCIKDRTDKNESTADCSEFAGAYANLLFRKSDNELRNINISDPNLPELRTLVENGIYDGNTIRGLIGSGCTPTWICVNWPAASPIVQEKSAARRPTSVTRLLNPISCPHISGAGGSAGFSACNTNSNVQLQPSIVIERLTAQDIDPQKQSLAVDGSASSRGIVFRITAVGYGSGANNPTPVMVQSTYVIPNI